MKTKTRFHKLTAWLLTVAMLMTFVPSFTLTASAAGGIDVDYDNKIIYANGIPITISENQIKETGSTSGLLFAESLVGYTIYGGSETADVESTSITIISSFAEDNSMKAIYAGGKDGNVTGTATITVAEDVTLGWATVPSDTVYQEDYSDCFRIFGGGYNGSVESSVININGTVNGIIFGGGENGSVTGNTNISVAGTVNDVKMENYANGVRGGVLYGGGMNGAVSGTANTDVSGTVVNSIYGGGLGENADVGAVSVTFSGTISDEAGRIYGGGYNGDVTGAVSINVNDGTVYNIYGGGYTSESTVDSATITVKDGTIGYIYGGGSYGGMTGHSEILFQDGTISEGIYGGSYGAEGSVGSTSIAVSGGTVPYVHGDYNGTVTGAADVTITGGTVEVNTAADQLVILGGFVTVNHNDFVTTDGGENGTAVIYVSDSAVERNLAWTGMIGIESGEFVVSGTAVATEEVHHLPSNVRRLNISIEEGSTLEIADEITLVNRGVVTNNGTIKGSGHLLLCGGASPVGSLVGAGTVEEGVVLYGVEVVCADDSWNYLTVTWPEDSNTAVYTDDYGSYRYVVDKTKDVNVTISPVEGYKMDGNYPRVIRNDGGTFTTLTKNTNYTYANKLLALKADAITNPVTINTNAVSNQTTVGIYMGDATEKPWTGTKQITELNIPVFVGGTLPSIEYTGWNNATETANAVVRIAGVADTYGTTSVSTQNQESWLTVEQWYVAQGYTKPGSTTTSIYKFGENNGYTFLKLVIDETKIDLEKAGTYEAEVTVTFDELWAEYSPRFDQVTLPVRLVVAEGLYFSTQPQDAELMNGTSHTLTIATTKADDVTGDVAYQWYTGEPDTGTPINGATGTSYAVPTDLTENMTYYCVATVGNYTATSRVAKVTVPQLVSTYTVEIASDISNGTVRTDKTEAEEGETVTLTVTPAEGYELDTLEVKDADNNNVAVTDNIFTMPASDVTVTATFNLITEHTINWSGSADVVNKPEFDLMPYLPEDISVENVSIVGLPNILSGYSPTYSSSVAKVELTTRVFDEPCSETVISVVKSSNYPDIKFNIVVTLTGKYRVTIKADAQDALYDGNTHAGFESVSGTLSNNDAYEGTYTYSYETADGTALDGTPTEAGDYKVTIAVPENDENYKGSVTIEFSIYAKPQAQYQADENGEWINSTFDEALSNVYDGGTVKLLDDIILDSTVAISKNITLTSDDADNICTITTETDAHGYLLNVTSNVTLENIIVDGGGENNLTAKRALIAVNGGKLNIGSGAVVRNNNNITSSGIGGGVCVITGELMLDGGNIIGNTGYFGGGVGLAGGTLTAKSGSITGNSAKMGGGVCVWENGANVGAMNVTGDVSISGNTAEYYGGGVNCCYKGSVTLSGNPIISNNTSPEETDGGIYLDGNKTDGHASTYVNGLTEGADVSFYTWLKSEGLRIAIPAEEYTITESDLAKMSWNGDDFVLAKSDDGNVVLAVVPDTYTVTVTNGTGSGEYSEGDTVTITANAPEEGKKFAGWTGLDVLTITEGSASDETVKFTMPAQAVNVTANYELKTYTVSFDAGEGTGTNEPVTGILGEYTLPWITTTSFTAPEGMEFKGWEINGTVYAENAKINVSSDITVTAIWVVPAEIQLQSIVFYSSKAVGYQLDQKITRYWKNGDSSTFTGTENDYNAKIEWSVRDGKDVATITLKGANTVDTDNTNYGLTVLAANTFDVDIVVEEDSVMDQFTLYSCDVSISGDGKLTIVDPKVNSQNIYVDGNLTLSGANIYAESLEKNAANIIFATDDLVIDNSKVEIKSGSDWADANYAALRANGAMTIENSSNVSVTCIDGTTCHAVMAMGDMTIEDSAVTVTNNGTNRGISSEKDIYINGTATVTVNSNGIAIAARNGKLTISGGTVSAESATTYAAIRADEIEISGGSVTATAADTYGIYAEVGDVAISGNANVSAEAKSSAAVYAKGNVIISDNVNIIATSESHTGIIAEKNIEISGSADVGANGKWALWSKANNIAISGGTVEATGSSYAMVSKPVLTSYGNPVVFAGANNTEATLVVDTAAANYHGLNYVKIQPGYIITFDANGGTITGNSVFATDTKGKLSAMPDDPAYAEHNFNGWFDSAEGGNEITTSTVFNANTTVYAQWTEKATASINEAPQTYTYDKTGKAFEIKDTTLTGFTVEYYVEDTWTAVAPTDAGTYDVRITRDEDDAYKAFEKEISGGLVINPIKVNIPEKDTTAFTYNKNKQTYTVEASDHYTVTGNEMTDAGSQEVKVSLKDKANYTWADGSTEDVVFTFTIAKAQAVITVDTTPIVKTYGDELILPTATTNFGTVEVDRTAQDMERAGTYTVTYKVDGTSNYDGDEKTVSVTINRLKVEKPAADTTEFTYNGQEQTYGIEESPLYTICNGKHTKAGSYAVYLKLNSNNYEWADGEMPLYDFKINRKEITRPAEASAVTYTGEALTYGVTETDDYTVTNGVQTAANEEGYNVIISLKDKDNTVWDSREDEDLIHKFIINRKAIEEVAGVTAPVAAQTAQTTVSGDNYSGTAQWNPDVTTFGYYTAYSVTVTLTADANHKFADNIALDGYSVSSNNGTTLVLTKTFDKTAKAKITVVTAPTVTELGSYYANVDAAINTLPQNIEVETEAGRTTLPITWEIVGTYNPTPEETNTFKWTANIGDYDVNSQNVSGTVSPVNADYIGVSNIGTPTEIAYDGNTFDISSMFTSDTNAGGASYEIVVLGTEGEGAGTLGADGKTITITKAGVITVKMTTAANGGYAQGTAQTTLTVKLGTGVGEVTIEGWTYGEDANAPVVTSTTNGTENVTYLYESTDGNGYNSDTAPTTAGAYKVTATFAATDLYAKTEDSAEFTIAKAIPAPNPEKVTTARVRRGQKLADATVTNGEFFALDGTTVLEGTFAWIDDTKEITADSTEKMKFTPADTNYAEIEIEVAVDSYTTGGGGSSSSNTTTTTTKNEDGSTTKTTTNKSTETTTEVTTNTDGSTTTVETKKDGTVTTTEKDKNGNTTTTVEKPDGTSTTTEKKKDGSETVVEKASDGTTTTTEKDSEGNKTVTTEKADGTTTTEETKKDGTKVTTETNADGETTAKVDAKGEKKVVIPVPDAEEVTKVVVTDKDGNETEVEFEVKDGGVAISVSGNSTVSVQTGHTCYAKDFTDVDLDAWYHLDIDYVLENGLMKGTAKDKFAPNDNLTRAMLVTVLYRLEGEPATNRSIPFADIDMGAYYANAVVWAQQNGIVKGESETEFAPNDNITREQIAAIMHRYAQYKGYDVSVGENTNILSYDDFADISEYAIAPMQYACGSGLMKGKTNSTLNPLDNATRAEIAAILHRFIEANK